MDSEDSTAVMRVGGRVVEVDVDKQAFEGETMIVTLGGAFVVKGSMLETAQRLAAEEWPTFELAESGDTVIIRSSQTVAVRGGTKIRRGHIGFAANRSQGD